MPVKVTIESQGMSSCGENFKVTGHWRYQGQTGTAEFLAWDSMPDSWVDGFRKMADAIQGAFDMCEHNVPDGGFCETCNAEYKRAAAIELLTADRPCSVGGWRKR
jgi:hypothetical protein